MTRKLAAILLAVSVAALAAAVWAAAAATDDPPVSSSAGGVTSTAAVAAATSSMVADPEVPCGATCGDPPPPSPPPPSPPPPPPAPSPPPPTNGPVLPPKTPAGHCWVAIKTDVDRSLAIGQVAISCNFWAGMLQIRETTCLQREQWATDLSWHNVVCLSGGNQFSETYSSTVDHLCVPTNYAYLWRQQTSVVVISADWQKQGWTGTDYPVGPVKCA